MSGQTYVTDIPRISSPDVCPPGQSEYTMEELNAYFANGIVDSTSDSIATNADTNRIPQAQLQTVSASKIKRQNESRSFTLPDGETKVEQLYLVVDKQVEGDTSLFKLLHEEYCHYERRYTYALKKFLDFATSRNPSDNQQATNMLNVTITLNRRLNFLIEFMNYLAVERASLANTNVAAINSINSSILKKYNELKIVYKKIQSMSVVTNTQKEMINYTKEKNNYVTNQISLWAALNVLAIATVFYVYRSS